MEATSKFIVEAKRRLSNYEQAKEKYKAFLVEKINKLQTLNKKFLPWVICLFKRKVKENIETINNQKKSYHDELNIDGLKKLEEMEP